EVEAEIEVPMWLPGQRQVVATAAQRDGVAVDARARAAAWRVAGLVREAAWAERVARAEVDVATRRVAIAESLDAAVEKRLRGGDIAKADRLQTRDELLAARGALAEARARQEVARAQWTRVTGLDALVDALEEVEVGTPFDERHPMLAGARATTEAAREAVNVAQTLRRDPPVVALQNRSDRDVTDGDFRNTVRLLVRIPFATDARNRPRIATAEADLTQAMTDEVRLRAEVAASVRQAHAELDAARAAADFARARVAAADEAWRLTRRGFEAGEIAVANVLLALARRQAADAASTTADIAAGRARSRLRQAVGLLP
ncbi:MAG: TolC family protein, partial [Burkholderiales bacterium]|nr:TolC family protein [Burkholderiales bacterium]